MNPKPYLVVSGLVFGVVALIHLLRVVGGWSFVVDGWSAPMWVSWVGLLVAGLLCGWAFRLAK